MTRPTARTLSLAALATAAALGGASLLPLAAGAQDAAAPTQAAPEAAAGATAGATPEATPAAIPDMTIGAEDAPIEVIEYGSFTCPHCAEFHETVYPELKAEWIDTGRVRFTFREVYFDRFGLWASMIARCGGEMRFFGIHDMLYEQQRDWIGDGEPAAIAEALRTMGRTAGLDDSALEACLGDEAEAEALVAWYQANAEADGITATPTFIIDGETHANMPWTEFEAVLEEKLAG